MYMTDFDEIRNLLDKSRSKDLDFKETLIKRTTEFVEELLLESIKIKHPFIPFRLQAMSTDLVQANILSGPYFQLSGKFLTRYGRDVGDYWEGTPIDYVHDNGYKTNDEGDPYSYACL